MTLYSACHQLQAIQTEGRNDLLLQQSSRFPLSQPWHRFEKANASKKGIALDENHVLASCSGPMKHRDDFF